MNHENINKNKQPFHALVAPLDWGLGHATRCIPIIRALIYEGARVKIAGDGGVVTLLQKEFPGIEIVPLSGYRIKYSRHSSLLFLKLLIQIPRILSLISYERKWLDNYLDKNETQLVISDNRFGLSSQKVKSVYITHQLFIETGNSFLNKLAQKIHYHFINRYHEIWIPDAAGKENLGGRLSHPDKLPVIPTKYLGIVSRFSFEPVEKTIDLLIIFSGPEPQRSQFEKIMMLQVSESNLSIVVVRGLPGKTEMWETKNIRFYDHLPGNELNKLMLASKLIIARCGYSTIMDLAVIKQKAILVPTPGQTEQEYLGEYLMSKKYFLVYKQDEFKLTKGLEDFKKFEFNKVSVAFFDEQQFSSGIRAWL